MQQAQNDVTDKSDLTQSGWFMLLGASMVLLIAWGVASDPMAILPGLGRIAQSTGLLISDYIAIAGLSAALVNAGLVGLFGLLLAHSHNVRLSGPVIAGVFTMAGFGFFGKAWWSIWPVILGVMLFSRVIRRPFKNYILVAMFGTALAPLVTYVAYGLEWGILSGLLLGGVAGFLLPPLAVYMLRLHQGFNLYNVGLTCGFLGLFIASLIGGLGYELESSFHWSETYNAQLRWFLLIYAGMLLVGGAIIARGPGQIRALLREPGTLPTDFVALYGAGSTLINMGLVGLLGWSYIVLVGGVFNGPTVGGVFTMIGFAAFGKHVLNALPAMVGVYLASYLFVWSPAQAGPLLAALFATTLAPLGGRFGPVVGVLAGMVHLLLVMRTGPWHAGLNLYNNGFAGGLTATLFVGLISWWSSWREEQSAKS